MGIEPTSEAWEAHAAVEGVTEWREGGKFPARKDCGDDAKGSFATFIHFLFHRGSPQEFAAKELQSTFFHSSQNSLTVPGPYPA